MILSVKNDSLALNKDTYIAPKPDGKKI